jgi:hypothetical protein
MGRRENAGAEISRYVEDTGSVGKNQKKTDSGFPRFHLTVMAGLVPAISINNAQNISLDRLCQEGLADLIRFAFQTRDQCLMFFSHWIAKYALA